MASKDVIAVPRWMLISGATALGGSLLVLAFLAGRLTGPEPVPAIVAPSPPASGAATANEPSTVTERATVNEPAAVASPRIPSAPQTHEGTARTVPGRSVSTEQDGNNAVIRYLDALDQALQSRNRNADPDALAQAIVTDALSGQTGAIDALLASTLEVTARVRGLSPPPPAAALHKQTMDLLERTQDVYRALREGIGSGDLASLAGLQTEATALERAAQAIDAETQRLRMEHAPD